MQLIVQYLNREKWR